MIDGALGQRIQAGKGGGVLAGVERGGNFAHGDVGVRHQQVDQRRLAHAGLADEDRRLARQQRRQRGHRVLPDRRAPTLRAPGSRARYSRRRSRAFGSRSVDVGLVEDQVRLDAGRFGRHQRARNQVVGKAGFGGDHDEQSRQVGRQQLGLVLVGAVQQRLALGDRLDHGLVVRGHGQVDDVAHGDIGLLAARDALQLASVGCRPDSGGHGRR